MGMNIYKLKKDGGHHIGKRYADGIWCWDCKKRAKYDNIGLFYFCIKCGQRCSSNTLSFHPGLRELGFDKKKGAKHIGIDGASGFTWRGKDKRDINIKLKGIKSLKTEYGNYWSINKFKRMFNDVIEENYSDCDFC